MSSTKKDASAGPAASAAGLRGRRKLSPMAREEQRAGITLLSPTLILVLVMVVLPILWTLVLAFQRVRILNIRTAGIFGPYTVANFDNVFSSSFFTSLGTTLAYSIFGTAGAIILGLIAALALRKPFKGRTLIRASMLIPYVSPIVAVTFTWTTMLDPQFGLINYWGKRLFGWEESIPFLSERAREVSILGLNVEVPTALIAVIVFEMWRSFPFAFLFLTARLNAVPESLEEAARVDGATPIQRFFHIILPQLLPTIAMLSVLRFIWTFNSFDDIYLLTGGGAGTEVVAVTVFNFLTARGDIGAASAQALVLALILGLFVGIYIKFFAKKEEVS
ncbi:sugar ABC transporter permease [Pseudarthrobacter sp. R1]|uniref:carbohydrate ABC transporter permease n=1 Tax=Pseudarthrobacter TaxID=1742993 RepID=UPI00210E4751|nr:sugar ABC transporter permease [Pseudarthrobacter sp. R1]MCQ6273259.1 sugar ABC transporter permease [Pseudarthrobacter sp. R1]